MAKKFEIRDILNAIDSISKIERGKVRSKETKNDAADKDDVLTPKNRVKSNKSEILVLERMIEQNNKTLIKEN